MRRNVLVPIAVLLAAAPLARAAETGGVAAPSESALPAAPGPARVQLSVGGSIHVGEPLPELKLRVAGRVPTSLRARLVLRDAKAVQVASASRARLAGAETELDWPLAFAPAAGRYSIEVTLSEGEARRPVTTARTSLVVDPRHDDPPVPSQHDGERAGVFPVAGPVTYGDGFGAPRSGYKHQGQDMAASQGTPVVAPRAGIVTQARFQAEAAGEYVVMSTPEGPSYFFAHCQRHSTAVRVGQAVAPGDLVCRVGSTGRSSGPHLHFEIWLGGWRRDSSSRPVDPLPHLRVWIS